jgi:hypothetical protein
MRKPHSKRTFLKNKKKLVGLYSACLKEKLWESDTIKVIKNLLKCDIKSKAKLNNFQMKFKF